MAVLLKVRNSQVFVDKLNDLLDNDVISIDNNSDNEQTVESWIVEKFANASFYTFYSSKSMWNDMAWFRVCPDDARKSFNESKGTSYNLIFRLHGTRSDDMTKELYGFYHSRFIEFIVSNLLDEIKELSITVSATDIKGLDRIRNNGWR